MKHARTIVSGVSIAVIIAVAAVSTAQPAGRVAVTNSPRYVPRAPSNLTVTQVPGTTTAELKWQNNSAVATHFEIEKRTKNPGGKAAILIEGAFSRAGHVFEMHDVPKMNTGDMIVFTGRFGDDHRERRMRMRINATMYNMATDEWFMVLVAMVPSTEHWNYEGVTTVAKASRRHTDIDLMLESANDSPVIHAVFTGWEAYQQATFPPFGMMVLGRGCGDPECKSCGGEGSDEDGDDQG